MSGAGRDGEVDLLVYHMIRQFWQFTSTLLSNIWLHARLGKQTWRAVKPSFPTHFASRNGFRFLAPGSRLPAPGSVFLASTLLLLFLPLPALLELSPSAISSSTSHTSAVPIHPGSQNLRPSLPLPSPPQKRPALKCRLRFLLEWAQREFFV